MGPPRRAMMAAHGCDRWEIDYVCKVCNQPAPANEWQTYGGRCEGCFNRYSQLPSGMNIRNRRVKIYMPPEVREEGMRAVDRGRKG